MRTLIGIWVGIVCMGCSLHATDWNEEKSVLKQIASAEASEWDRIARELGKENLCQTLNEWSDEILKQTDGALIHLLQRALNNYNALSEEKTAPFVSHYKHYQAPSFAIPQIHLTLDVQKEDVLVTTLLRVERTDSEKELVLNGVGHEVQSIFLNGKQLPRESYRVTPNELIVLALPDESSFVLSIKSKIDPFHNTSLEGLYATGGGLLTQCESEGARRIFFTLDRPDVLSRITTAIVADPKDYPCRLSNGNCIEETLLADGRIKIVWEDPIPKPSYLFACVMGDFARVKDLYRTKSGREVSLEVYVPHGTEKRGLYSLYALKKAMLFDEQFFDREYDLESLKVVAAPDFNSGAMENKGLLIFNALALLIDPHTGTDGNFRRVAEIVAHEYFHNWSGNRVTVRNWFELALKEAFTDFRTTLFSEWLFGSALIRPQDVANLREEQFPEEFSASGHPIMVESFVNARSIYDGTTYVKGREVFRALQTYLDAQVPGGFRKAQNLYFERYDGQAVTFRELLSASNEILQAAGKGDLSQFERWFTQQGTPRVRAAIHFNSADKTADLILSQSCLHPRTGQEQEPLLIPFSYELLRRDGTVVIPKQEIVLSEKEHRIPIAADEPLVPLFMHGYTAPVILDYPYTFEELSCLTRFANDPFGRWEAHQNHSLLALQIAHERIQKANGQPVDLSDLFQNVVELLQSKTVPILVKGQLLQVPSLRSISQKMNDYNFASLEKTRTLYRRQLAAACLPVVAELLQQHPQPSPFAPTADQMALRTLRKGCWDLLTLADPSTLSKAIDEGISSDNFDTQLAAFRLLVERGTPEQLNAMDSFYHFCKQDKVVLNHWLSAQALSSRCTVADLKKLMQTPGFDGRNPNHIRSVLRVFINNLSRFHDEKGEGYAFIVDQILSIAPFNPHLAHSYLAEEALVDYTHLPESQRALLRKEMLRLMVPSTPPETRALISSLTSQ